MNEIEDIIPELGRDCKISKTDSHGMIGYCDGSKIVKAPQRKLWGLCSHYLSSRAVTRQVLSAQMSLTSVFGMGTGGPSL